MAKADRKRFNQQEAQAFTAGQQASDWGLQEAQQTTSVLLPRLRTLLAAPGYTEAEKQAIRNAGALSTAAAYGDAQTELANRVAATGNSAGFLSAAEQLGRMKARDSALRNAQLESTFADQRLNQQQLTIRDLEALLPDFSAMTRAGYGLQSDALNDQARMAASSSLWQRALLNSLRWPGVLSAMGSPGRG